MKCICCGKTLVAVGKQRVNGKNHDDWTSRMYHKECWKHILWKDVYFDVPFKQKDLAKSLGARWEPVYKSWYSPNAVIEGKMREKDFKENDDLTDEYEDYMTYSNYKRRKCKYDDQPPKPLKLPTACLIRDTICLSDMMSKIEIDLIDELKKI